VSRLGGGRQRDASPATIRNVVQGDTYEALLHAHRSDEDRMAARGYYAVRTAYRALPPWRRLRAQLRMGPFAELGGTLEIEYLARPEVRRPETSSAPLAP
jgi:hypothetical protein